MHPDLIKAQVETLREWAAMWDATNESGSSEVGFLLRRAAKQAEGGNSSLDREPMLPMGEADHLPHVEETEIRHG